jgi:hypothetical protein
VSNISAANASDEVTIEIATMSGTERTNEATMTGRRRPSMRSGI